MPANKTASNEHQHMLRRVVRIGPSTCFVCSVPLRSNNRSDEHVFPKWLQNKYNLWDQRLNLLNLTSIPYRQLTIPCCKSCNNIHLSKIEAEMQAAVESGPCAVASLPSPTLYMWLSKLFYGVLYRENLLLANRRGGRRPIVPKRVLRDLRLHHDFMQGIRRSLEFPRGVPGSIFIFGTASPNRTEGQFDFVDNHHDLSLAIRMGEVGIVCCLQDGGLTKGFHDYYEESYHLEDRLHSVQFREIAAKIFYKSMLLESGPLYTVIEDPNRVVVLTKNPADVRFRPWDNLDFCIMLAFYWNQSLREIYGGGDHRATSIRDEENEFRTLDPNTPFSFFI